MSKYHSLALWTCVATLSLPTISAAADVRKSSQTHIEQPSSFDMTVLDKAFHKLLTDTAFGYALCGNKPISLETVSCPQNLFPGTPNHKWAVIMSEFAGSWKKLQLNPDRNYFILISNFVQPPNEMILVNRKAFLNVVNENLLLFRQHLGLNVTAESLLSRLLEGKESLFNILSKNTALLGIILGYGTENSLFFERGSLLTQQILENSPKSPLLQIDLPPQNETEVIGMIGNYSKDAPSFGYSSIIEEINDSSNLIGTSLNSSKNISFTYLKNSNESIQLIKNYTKNSSTIDKLLDSQDFLNRILQKFDLRSTIPESKENPLFDDQQRKNMSQWVAQSIWKQLITISQGTLNPISIDRFLAGMKKAANRQAEGADSKEVDLSFFERFYHQRADKRVQQKLDEIKKYFSKLASQGEAKCIIPSKLYYKTIPSGSGEDLSQHTAKIFAHYLIKDMNGKILHGTFKLETIQAIDLSLAIPGLAHGIVGMKKNEVREIFIHPDFAYGVYSEFGSGKAISVQIELLDFETDFNQKKFPELIPIDLQHIANGSITSKSHLEQLEKEYLFFSGFRTWTHYSKAEDLIKFEEVLKALHNMQAAGQTDVQLNETEIKTLNRLHWLIYHSE